MKKISIVLFVFATSLVVAQKSEKVDTTKIYMLSQVDEAPKLFNYPLRDSLTSTENFKRNLRYFIGKNVQILTDSKNRIEKTYVEFFIDKDGNIKVGRVRGKSKQVKEYSVNVIKKIKKMIPAKIRGISVSMKYIVPITFASITIGEKKYE